MKALAVYITDLRKAFARYGAATLEQYGLTDGTYQYLIYISKRPGSTPGEMAEWFHMDHGHITRCILRLEKLGYVDREKSEKDRRQVLLYPTEQGELVYKNIHTLMEDWDCQALKELTEEERSVLLSLLDKVERTLEGEE